jgi:SNF family Na+-dependent transporter
VEIPDLLRLPRPKETEEEKQPPATRKAVEADEEVVPPASVRRRGRLTLPVGRWSNPLLLIAAGLLVVGAILGNWFALLLGWLIAYASRRLTQNESKWAVIGMPGVALTAGIVWLWGRNDGRWGDPVAHGHMNDAIAQTWPWVVRGAAVLSALFVVWRSQRKT